VKRNLFVLPLTLSVVVMLSSETACYGESPPGRSYLLNIVGASDYEARYWKPRAYNLEKADWDIRFGDQITMSLRNKASEFGHIACGAWWTTNFIDRKKLPLQNVTSLRYSVDVRLTEADYSPSHSIPRMAVVAVINRDGVVRYVELDFRDTPAAYALFYPDGNKYFNGTDEYSYALNKIPPGWWLTIKHDFLPYMKECWGDLSRAALESVYVVIESDGRKYNGTLEKLLFFEGSISP
jgi:hypothetical protein